MKIKACSALVAGSASELGLATATEFVAASPDVVIADLATSPGLRNAKAIGRHIVENAYLNAVTIRLDGAMCLPPR
jgi:NAD(P)-dependent dehydrogenase (short-subunit alcohol dehydrogenase family)